MKYELNAVRAFLIEGRRVEPQTKILAEPSVAHVLIEDRKAELVNPADMAAIRAAVTLEAGQQARRQTSHLGVARIL